MSAAKLGTPGTRKSSRKEPNAQPKTGSYEQQDFVKRKECIIGGCIYNDPIGNATAGVPELLLWPTNDNDPYDRCLFHRLLVRTKKVTTQRWYREAKNFAKKDKLDRIEDALVKEWLHILNRFLIEDHVLPSLEQYRKSSSALLSAMERY